MECPTCGKGIMQKVIIKKYQAKLRNITFPVKDAEMLRCNICDEEVYSAKEIKRWESILKGIRSRF
jgi:hypothetical protein